MWRTLNPNYCIFTYASRHGTCGSVTSLFKADKEQVTSDFKSMKLLDGLCVTFTGITGSRSLPLVRGKILP